MITFSNLFQITSLSDDTTRIDFKVNNPLKDDDQPTVATIYMTRAGAAALAEGITKVLNGEPMPVIKLD